MQEGKEEEGVSLFWIQRKMSSLVLSICGMVMVGCMLRGGWVAVDMVQDEGEI